jgi:dolichol kinase
MRRAQEGDRSEEEYASIAWGSSGISKEVPKGLELPNIIQRKYFHALATGLLLPSYLIDTQWTCLAAAVALALLILREAVRVFHLPPLAESIHVMTAAFVDDRDIGVVVVSPLYLQLGLSLPFWLHSLLAPDSSPLPALAGILTVGVADSVASLVGTYFGRHRWPQSKKTIEGSLGAFLSILLVVGLVRCVSSSLSEFSWPGVLVMAAFSALLEAATSQFDNLFLPLVAFSILCAFET